MNFGFCLLLPRTPVLVSSAVVLPIILGRAPTILWAGAD
jgi:hypothetical protein